MRDEDGSAQYEQEREREGDDSDPYEEENEETEEYKEAINEIMSAVRDLLPVAKLDRKQVLNIYLLCNKEFSHTVNTLYEQLSQTPKISNWKKKNKKNRQQKKKQLVVTPQSAANFSNGVAPSHVRTKNSNLLINSSWLLNKSEPNRTQLQSPDAQNHIFPKLIENNHATPKQANNAWNSDELTHQMKLDQLFKDFGTLPRDLIEDIYAFNNNSLDASTSVLQEMLSNEHIKTNIKSEANKRSSNPNTAAQQKINLPNPVPPGSTAGRNKKKKQKKAAEKNEDDEFILVVKKQKMKNKNSRPDEVDQLSGSTLLPLLFSIPLLTWLI